MESYFGTGAGGRGGRYDRPWLNTEFDDAMDRGNGGRLFGLRRVGKSTEAEACIERQRDRAGVTAIHLNAEGCGNEGKMLLDLLKILPQKGWLEHVTARIGANNAIALAVREGLQKFTGTPADLTDYFAPIAEAIESTLGKADRLVLVIDEFPWLARSILEADPARGRSRVNQLLATLRRWRGGEHGMRMLLVGSIGMAALGRRYDLDLSHLRDMAFLEVPPLEDNEANEFITALAQGVTGWSDGHTTALLEESVAYYPSVLQAGFQYMTPGTKALPLARIPDLFADKVRPNLDQNFFSQFDKRVQLYRELPPPSPDLLRTILDLVMKAPDQQLPYPDLCAALAVALPTQAGGPPVFDDADLGEALTILREDGFVSVRAPRNAPQIWRAASGLVTAWWSQRHGGA